MFLINSEAKVDFYQVQKMMLLIMSENWLECSGFKNIIHNTWAMCY